MVPNVTSLASRFLRRFHLWRISMLATIVLNRVSLRLVYEGVMSSAACHFRRILLQCRLAYGLDSCRLGEKSCFLRVLLLPTWHRCAFGPRLLNLILAVQLLGGRSICRLGICVTGLCL